MEKHKTCCVTGHRPGGFPWDYNNKNCQEHKEYLQTMYSLLEKLITKDGYDYFISGGAIGVDTDFAEAVLYFKKLYPHIMLEVAVPCENQDLKWNNADKAKYQEILKSADIVTVLSKSYTRFCMQKRNQYMVDKSDFALAFWNANTQKGGTYSTIKYIECKHMDYELICLDEFTEEHKKFESLMDRFLERRQPTPEQVDAFMTEVQERLKNKGKK